MVLDSFPSVIQAGDADCGPACCSALLRYWGIRQSVQTCTGLLYTSGMDGTDPRTIEAFLRSHGLHVLAGEMSLEDIREQTRRGRPVLCVLQGHYVVALSVWRGRVYLHDPAEGRVALKSADFEARWRDTDRLGVRYERFGLSVWRPEQ